MRGIVSYGGYVPFNRLKREALKAAYDKVKIKGERSVANYDEDSITMDTSFVDDLNADSVDLMDLSVALEEEFGIEEMADEDVSSITTVGDVVRFLQSRIGFRLCFLQDRICFCLCILQCFFLIVQGTFQLIFQHNRAL
mgnify:CR=1 FL=1